MTSGFKARRSAIKLSGVYLAQEVGLEPTWYWLTASRVTYLPLLKNWHREKESNPRRAGLQPAALPLSYLGIIDADFEGGTLELRLPAQRAGFRD